MNFMVNTSPLAGREGKFVTSRQVRDRLDRELKSNVALRVRDTGDDTVFEVSGRGELHLTILLETMRREGYALAVSRPRVVVKDIDGVVETFKPGTMEGWGLGWEDLRAINPGLVMLRVSGYGQTGPYRDLPGFGAIGEAMGGLRHLSGEPDRTPVRVGISIGDSLTARVR
ncbi:hypothetical protein G6F24_016441 [Rhizopus arrhizus]|nr:hypothetical protein G6F24_016441 [Rhizopus arrhizus]